MSESEVRMSKRKKINKKEAQNFINTLVLMKYEAGRLGLFKTMHALEEPQRIAGYEFAEMLEEEIE